MKPWPVARLGSWLPACAVVLGALIFFWPLWLGRAHLVPFHLLAGDPALQGIDESSDRPDWRFFDSSPITMFYAEKSLAAREVRSGALPLWNPYNGLGVPLLGDSISQPLSPFFLPFVLLSNPWTYSFALVLHLLWGGLGMVLFLRRIGLGTLAQAAGAVLFAFSPHALNYLGYSDVWAVCWFPWVLWAFEGMAAGTSGWPLPSILVALMGMSGHLELAFFGAAGSMTFGILRRFQQKGRAGVLTWALVPLAALGLSSWWVLPFLEFLTHATSGRFGGNVPHPYHPSACLLPGSEVYWGPVLLLLAAAGWGVHRHRRVLLATLPMAVWGAAMMFPLPEMIQRILTFDFACGRYGRGMVWACLAVWASVGIEGLLRREVGRGGLLLAGGVGLAAWAASVLVTPPSLGALQAARFVPLTGEPAPLWSWLSLAAVSGLVLLAAAGWKKVSAWTAAAGLACLMLASELAAHPVLDVSWNRSAPSLAAVVNLHARETTGRVWFPEHGLWKSLPPNLSAIFAIRDVRACGPLAPRELVRLNPAPHPNKDLFQSWDPARMRFLGVNAAFTGAPGGPLAAAVIAAPLERAIWVSDARGVLDPATAAKMALENDAWLGTAFLAGWGGQVSGSPGRVTTPSPASVSAVEDAPTRSVWRVDAPAAGWLVLRDLHWPGWQARVDGRPARIRPADGVFRAVEVGAGAHEVAFRYLPASFVAGVAATGLTVLFVSMVIFRGRRGGSGEASRA